MLNYSLTVASLSRQAALSGSFSHIPHKSTSSAPPLDISTRQVPGLGPFFCLPVLPEQSYQLLGIFSNLFFSSQISLLSSTSVYLIVLNVNLHLKFHDFKTNQPTLRSQFSLTFPFIELPNQKFGSSLIFFLLYPVPKYQLSRYSML